ncbi:hypothetical protein M3936_03555 [Sutcliffiella horikoshii]|uniref:hypothetical protein n=1 Tax=Sutcliffiella horikoshii TaxID=79883 RepID=UPI0020418C6A|nr:hypothetical protein [Sutcliffiella horikoshii]MCM3616652.1 hypothetical protein [Sutcliffiella horikoshii]
MKRVDERVSYYVRKVAERATVNKAEKLPKAYGSRSKRLMQYKQLMHQLIEEGGIR